MSKPGTAPTKSNLLSLRRQLALAEEGYDLLEQKRQILIFELMGQLNRARETEARLGQELQQAFASLREAQMDIGSDRLDRATFAISMEHRLTVSYHHLMGMKLPLVKLEPQPVRPPFGISDTSGNLDVALRRFVELLPVLAELAGLQTAILRLARELRKTQRRCNALSRIFIPGYRESIAYIVAALEEREREALVILKMIRNRLFKAP